MADDKHNKLELDERRDACLHCEVLTLLDSAGHELEEKGTDSAEVVEYTLGSAALAIGDMIAAATGNRMAQMMLLTWVAQTIANRVNEANKALTEAEEQAPAAQPNAPTTETPQ